MKLLQSITGTIDHLAGDGSGVIPRAEGKPYLVYNTVPGETIHGTVVKRVAEGHRVRLDEVVHASPDRVTARCPYAGTCGGCKWQHLSYARQLEEKRARLERTFAQANIDLPTLSVVGAEDPFYYRNRMDFVFGRNGELGLKLPDRWWTTLDLETCYLLSPESVEIVNTVRTWARSTGLPFWNSKTREGFFRYLVIREGKNTGERMVMLVTSSSRPLPSLSTLSSLSNVSSLTHGISDRLTDLSIADQIIPLKGDPWIHEDINGVRYKITPNAFFQTNTHMAERLQNEVVQQCEESILSLRSNGEAISGIASVASLPRNDTSILDLYCGSGFFSLALAKQHPDWDITGIEEVSEAITCAKENAQTNGVRVEYHVSRAEDYNWAASRPDVVIVDPPRAGLHPRVIETLLTAGAHTVIYVSCKYDRFVQEWNGTASNAPALSTRYRLVKTSAFDLFPQTPHIEFVARLERID